jgi:hypothetical protein
VLQRDRIEHAKFRALAQVLVDKDKGIAAFDEYRNIHFPWLETHKKRDKEDHIRALMGEIKKGALVVTPKMDKQIRSRLKVAKTSPPVIPGSSSRSGALYRKLGMVVPIK